MLQDIRHSKGGSFGELKQTTRELLIGDNSVNRLAKKDNRWGEHVCSKTVLSPSRILSLAGLRDVSSARVSREWVTCLGIRAFFCAVCSVCFGA